MSTYYIQSQCQCADAGSQAIACRYLKTLFFFDLCVVSIDVAAGFLSLVEEVGPVSLGPRGKDNEWPFIMLHHPSPNSPAIFQAL